MNDTIDNMDFSDETSGRLVQYSTFEHVRNENFDNFEEISASGYNRIVRAQRYGKYFVLKALLPQYKDDPYYRQLLRKEFDLSLGMDHPNIVRVYGMEEVEPFGLCIVMAYIDGRPLDAYLKESPSKASRRRVARQLIDTLSYCHSQQIVHRDLKPSNVMVTKNGDNVRLIDFGLSDADYYAILKEPAFSRRYASPEQLRGEPLDCRTDIYSFGLLLREIFPRGYRRVVRKCCSPNRDKRYANASMVQNQFGVKWRDVLRAAAWVAAVVLIGGGVWSIIHIDLDPFEVETPEGIHLKCAVLDGKAHILGGTDLKGHLIIPAKVRHGWRQYAVEEIDSSAFMREQGITHLTLPEGLKTVSTAAFFECANLTDTLVLPMSLERVFPAAFCATDFTHVILRSRNLKRGTKDRTMDVFFSCAHLKQMVIDTTVENVDEDMWTNSYIEEVVFPDCWEAIPVSSIVGVANLKSIVWPSNVKIIRDAAFWAVAMPRLVLPESVVSVAGYAFRWGSCRYVELGSQVEYIGAASLANLQFLDTLVIKAPTPPQVLPTTFEGTNTERCVLLVPAESVEAYKQDEVFSRFKIRQL